jgi:hypothetical protein
MNMAVSRKQTAPAVKLGFRMMLRVVAWGQREERKTRCGFHAA